MPYYYPAPDFAAEDIAATGGITAVGNISTTAGTVSAEQVTSTDDATVADQLLLTEAAGAHVATPTVAFGDGDTGLFESADDTLNFGSEGVAVFQINTGDQVVLLEAAGAHAATPTLAFGDGDSGLFESADDTLNIVSEGVAVAQVNTGDQLVLLEAPGAHQAAPTLAFGDGDTGLYEAADDYLVISVAGTPYEQLTASEIRPLVSFKAGASFGLENALSPTGLTGNTNDWSPTNIATRSAVRMDSDGAYQLTGLAGNNAGKFIFLMNISAFTITLMHDVTSTAANRFLCPGSVDFSLLANASCWLFYDSTSARWRVVG